MITKKNSVVALLAAAGLAACGGAAVTPSGSSVTPTSAVSPVSQLIIGGDSANFGIHQLTMGFMPDPHAISVTSGGRMDAAAADTDGVVCGGWVTAEPDVIVNFTEMSGFLRFAFRPETAGEDATLVVNDGNGNWHCNDDAVGLNPVVDLGDAPPGQYDVWIGSYQQGEYISGQLLISELDSTTP